MGTKFCMWVPSICGSSVWNLLNVTFWLLNFEVAPNFWKYVHPWFEVHVVTSVYMCNNFHTCPVICSTSFGLAQRRVYRCKSILSLFSLYVFKHILSTEAQLFGLSVSPTTVSEIRYSSSTIWDCVTVSSASFQHLVSQLSTKVKMCSIPSCNTCEWVFHCYISFLYFLSNLHLTWLGTPYSCLVHLYGWTDSNPILFYSILF
jgi:hypothetical protein